MDSIASSAPKRKIVVGVDTHKHLHVAVALDELGARLGELTISADSDGYAALAAWAEQIGRATAFGIEGTGSYGVGLTSFLRRRGHRDRRGQPWRPSPSPLEREVGHSRRRGGRSRGALR